MYRMRADRRMVRDLEIGSVFIVPASFRYYRRLSRRQAEARALDAAAAAAWAAERNAASGTDEGSD